MTTLEILFLIFIVLFVIREVCYFKFFQKRLSNSEVIIAGYFTNNKNAKDQVGFIQHDNNE
jgi:hypothetical protein